MTKNEINANIQQFEDYIAQLKLWHADNGTEYTRDDDWHKAYSEINNLKDMLAKNTEGKPEFPGVKRLL